jgi:cobalt-zinc-cadmium efflux system protein
VAHVHAHPPHGHHPSPTTGHAHAGLPSAEAAGTQRAFLIGTALNVGFIVVEVVFGLLSGSVALLADAAHNVSDVFGLVLAWGAMALARRKPSMRRTYGMRRATVLAALANAVLLLSAIGAVAWEAVGRIRSPAPVDGPTVVAVAAAGVVVNGLSAALFFRGDRQDVNVRAAFLHLAVDAAISLGVVVSGLIVWATAASWVDPTTSLVVSGFVLFSTWELLRDAANLALDAVPDHVDPEAVRRYLAELPGVCEVHDLHIWALSTTETALTAHLVLPWPEEPPEFLTRLDRELAERFRIGHATVQLEPSDPNHPCRLGG